MKVPSGEQAADVMMAVWPDGSEWQVTQLTVSMYEARGSGAKKKGIPTPGEWVRDVLAVNIGWR